MRAFVFALFGFAQIKFVHFCLRGARRERFPEKARKKVAKIRKKHQREPSFWCAKLGEFCVQPSQKRLLDVNINKKHQKKRVFFDEKINESRAFDETPFFAYLRSVILSSFF